MQGTITALQQDQGPVIQQDQGPVENNTMWGPELVEGPPHHNSTATSLRLAMISHGAL
jgi:hypothetical protein